MIKKLEMIIGVLLLTYAIWFNFNLYKLEPTATTDPNDNNFQYGLVDRANQMWDYATRECSKQFILIRPLCHLSIMIDHWVPNWAQGYNLPFYYSHVPQIVIVGSFRFLSQIGLLNHMSLFQYYHYFIYWLLCLFPISLFAALRVIKLPWIVAGAGAYFASHISTDGLYGLDPPSFLWRGWGLSSQLYAMMFLPPALAYIWKFFNEYRIANIELRLNSLKSYIRYSLFIIHKSDFWLAVIFTVLTTMGHLGIGVVVILSIVIMAFASPIYSLISQKRFRDIQFDLFHNLYLGAFIGIVAIFFLAYWVIPTMLSNNYHNISVWDPIWKFNSYGWKETLIRFFNGDLFDFGRFPYLTFLTIIGIFSGSLIQIKNKTAIKSNDLNAKDELSENSSSTYFAFSLTFLFWLLMYFGRTTWGKAIDLIPGMTEYHLSRFIVGLHAFGFFLVPIGLWWIATSIENILKTFFLSKKHLKSTSSSRIGRIIIIGILLIFIAPPVYKQTTYYNELNDRLIKQAVTNASKVQDDTNNLLSYLHTLPSGRIFAGRGGGWGKNFKIAETEMFMYLSTFGFNTVLWLPETWSPNSDTEQFFSEDQQKDYDLYNIRYVVAPPDQKAQSFWKEKKRSSTWVVYDVETSGYFTPVTRSMIVVSDKQSFINLVHLWIQSKIPVQKLYPELIIGNSWTQERFKIPTIKMVDEVTYLTAQNTRQNIFAINPLYGGDMPKASLIGQEEVTSDMIFKTNVNVEPNCRECYLVLKQSYHPNWKATIDGKPVKPIEMFPSYVAIPISTQGKHQISMWYEPSSLKIVLMVLGIFTASALVIYFIFPRVKPIIIKLKK